jgi:hypothetical protein
LARDVAERRGWRSARDDDVWMRADVHGMVG